MKLLYNEYTKDKFTENQDIVIQIQKENGFVYSILHFSTSNQILKTHCSVC